MTNFRLLLLVSAVASLLSACREEAAASPDETYRAYYAKVVEGRTFQEDAAFHAASRREQVAAQISAQVEGSDKAREEIEEFYLGFTQSVAKCGTLTLVEERVTDDRARLVYSVADTCAGAGDGELIVEMVDEDGWKVLSDELILKAN